MRAYGFPRTYYIKPKKDHPEYWDDMTDVYDSTYRFCKRKARAEGKRACQEPDE